MEHRRIGALTVPVVGLGCNQLGTAACDAATAERIVGEAIDAGVTLFDTSDEYGRDYAHPEDLSGWGRTEEILGRALKGRRDKVILATKFGPLGDPRDPKGGGMFSWPRSEGGARGIAIAVEESLSRLGTDYIDLYQLHFPEPRFPVDETLGALDRLVREGKVREIGCCNFSGAQLREAAAAASTNGFRPFGSSQNMLNALQRGAAADVLPACDELGMAFIPYYPLASGMLTGKYRRGEPPPGGTRLVEQVDEASRKRILSDRNFARLEGMEGFAKERGHTLLELAFAWLLAQKTCATVIAGAAKPGQVSANARAAGWRITPEEAAEVVRLASVEA